MKKQHLFENRLFLAGFDTRQSKDDVTMALTIAVFERFCAIVLSCHVWW